MCSATHRLSRRCRKPHGFTLIELILVVLLTSLLAVIVAPRFQSGSEFNTRGVADSLQSMFRYAQKAAIASRRNVCVLLVTTSAKVWTTTQAGTSPVCVVTQPVQDPYDPANPYVLTLPSGISMSPAVQNITFDSQGRPNIASTLSVVVTGSDYSRTFYIEPETGYVHD